MNGRKVCDRKKSLTINSNTIEAEGLGHLFQKLRKSSSKTDVKIAEKVIKNPGRAIKTGAKFGNEAVSRSLEAPKPTIFNVLTFLCHTNV